MILWRISNYADLKGLGGLKAEGRWHSAGSPIVYLADHSASAMLEMLVHLELDAFPANYQILKIEVPDKVSILAADLTTFPENWRESYAFTQAIGDAWLAQAPSALLMVPSALTVEGNNYLLNPAHPDAALCQIVGVITPPLDPRLGKPR